MRFNNDTAANYADRLNANQGTDTTDTTVTAMKIGGTSANPQFIKIFVVTNLLVEEKQCIIHSVDTNTAGASNAPNRQEGISKWVNTSVQATEVDIITSASTFAAGTTLSVYGSD
jgi:hypothetical protein